MGLGRALSPRLAAWLGVFLATGVTVADCLSSIPFWIRGYGDGNPSVNVILSFSVPWNILAIIILNGWYLILWIPIDLFVISKTIPTRWFPRLSGGLYLAIAVVYVLTSFLHAQIVYDNLLLDHRMGWV